MHDPKGWEMAPRGIDDPLFVLSNHPFDRSSKNTNHQQKEGRERSDKKQEMRTLSMTVPSVTLPLARSNGRRRLDVDLLG